MWKKWMALTMLAVASAGTAAEALWDGALDRLSLREGAKLKEVSVKSEDGTLVINALSEGDSVTYVCLQIPTTPCFVTGKRLSLEAWSDTPKETIGFYVRALTADNRKVLSFQKWDVLTDRPEVFVLTPGTNGRLRWESTEVQAPDGEITKLWIYIGARGNGKKMNLRIRDLKWIDDPLAEFRAQPGRDLAGSTNGQAFERNGVIAAEAAAGTGTVTYFDFQLPIEPVSVEGKQLNFTAWSKTPDLTKALYVRGYNAAGECILSYKSWNGLLAAEPKEFRLAIGQNASGLVWEPEMVKDTADKKLTQLRFYIGTRGNRGQVFSAEFSKISVGGVTPGVVLSAAGFEKLGVGARSAEIRSLIAGEDAAGKRFILCRPQDHGERGYLLFTELDSGRTFQYFNPDAVRQGDNFGSVLTRNGKFYYDQAGGHVLCFDVNTRKTEYLGRPDTQTQHFMVYTEGPDGRVWMGGYPHASVTAYDPRSGKFRNYGSMDPREKYLYQIAVDRNGWVYSGVGSARANILALDPESGKITQLLPEEKRGLGYGRVVAGQDGYVYADYRDFRVQLLDGKIVAENVACPAPAAIKAPKYGGSIRAFSDGSRVLSYDLYQKKAVIREADGRMRTFPFSYLSGGLQFTSIARGPNGKIYGSTCHPMHFVELDPANGEIIDHGPHPIVLGGNFCNMVAGGGKLYACEYAGGRLWEYDPAQPIRMRGGALPSFGPTPEELAVSGKAEKGHFSALSAPRILFANGHTDGAVFTLPVRATKAGKAYLNVLLFEHAQYGTVTVAFQGKSEERNVQNLADRPSKMLTLGPFELQPGDYEVTFTVRANRGGKPWFGLVGMELADAPREGNAAPKEANPRILGRWSDLVTRPRAIAVHSDGRHVIIAGYANYGLTGGGFGIHDLKTGENREIKDWLPGHSCIAFRVLPDGDLIGGTSINAPGGGHIRATEAALFRLDWKSGKVKRSVPLPGATNVISVELWKGKLVAVTSDGQLLTVHPETLEIMRREQIGNYGSVPRNALQKSDDNRLFVLLSNHILELDPVSGAAVPIAGNSAAITAGGACIDGALYFGCWTNFGKYRYPETAPGQK